MGFGSRFRGKSQVPHEILVDQYDRIGGVHSRISRQTGQYGINLSKSMPADPEGTPGRPASDRLMRLVRCHEQGYGHTRVDG